MLDLYNIIILINGVWAAFKTNANQIIEEITAQEAINDVKNEYGNNNYRIFQEISLLEIGNLKVYTQQMFNNFIVLVLVGGIWTTYKTIGNQLNVYVTDVAAYDDVKGSFGDSEIKILQEVQVSKIDITVP